MQRADVKHESGIPLEWIKCLINNCCGDTELECDALAIVEWVGVLYLEGRLRWGLVCKKRTQPASVRALAQLLPPRAGCRSRSFQQGARA